MGQPRFPHSAERRSLSDSTYWNGRQKWVNKTYRDDPVLGAVRVGATHVEAAVAHLLDHADVIPALELLAWGGEFS